MQAAKVDQPKVSKAEEKLHQFKLTTIINFAEFCRRLQPASVATDIRPQEMASVRDDIAVIDAWLSRFAVARDGKREARRELATS
jgi:hypothetical protein